MFFGGCAEVGNLPLQVSPTNAAPLLQRGYRRSAEPIDKTFLNSSKIYSLISRARTDYNLRTSSGELLKILFSFVP